MKLYFVRHGQTDANVKTTNGEASLDLDDPLNEMGMTQASMLAKDLDSVKFDAIITSPLKRAYQTAIAVNKYHNLPLNLDAAWRERRIDVAIDADIWNDLFDFDLNLEMQGVEPLDDFFQRVYQAIDALKMTYADKTVLIVSHGGVQHALYAYANDAPLTGNMRVKPMQNGEFRVFEL